MFFLIIPSIANKNNRSRLFSFNRSSNVDDNIQIIQTKTIIIYIGSNMNKKQEMRKIDDEDISVIEGKRNRFKNIYNAPNPNKEAEMFRPTESDLEEDSQAEVKALDFLQNDEEKQRKLTKISKEILGDKEKVVVDVPKRNGFESSVQRNDSRIMNINLTNSIPFTLLVPKNSQKSEGPQDRRYKIFQVIKFELPSLDEYYTKNKLDNEMSMSLGLNDQASINRQLNGSQYSFFQFRREEPKIFKKKTLLKTMKSKNSSNVGRSSRVHSKNTYIHEDEIKQQSIEDEQNENKGDEKADQREKEEKSKGKLQGLNSMKDYQAKGVYLLLGFLISTITMILIRNFI